MAYSDSFPAVRPVFQADFANGGRIDPRATFSRSDTPPTYAAPSAVHYWSNEKHLSSENLLLQSQSFDTSWAMVNGSAPSGSQSAPDGTSTAWLLTANTGSSQSPRLRQAPTLSATTEYTLTVFLKAGTASHGFIAIRGQSGHSAYALIDFSAGTASSAGSGFSGVSNTVTALGASWFKLSLTATTNSSLSSQWIYIGPSDGTAPSSAGYPAWNTSGETMYAWGAQLNTTGATVYDSPTTTQIARSYASSLKSVSYAGQPRFEYDPTDGESEGILIESASTNLVSYSESFSNQTVSSSTLTEGAAVGPDGTLSANLLVPTATGTLARNVNLEDGNSFSHTSGDNYAYSIFAKAAGYNYVQWVGLAYFGYTYCNFDLSNGTVGSKSGSVTGSVESVGNGWYRLTVVAPATATNSSSSKGVWAAITSSTSGRVEQFTGDGYSGVLLTMAQCELGSFSSSYIKSDSGSVSGTTRAADSLSLATADIGYTGGSDVSVYAEVTPNGATNDPRLFTLDGGSVNNRLTVDLYQGTKITMRMWTNGTQVINVSSPVALTGPRKVVLSAANNDFKLVQNGTQIGTDTSGVMSEFAALDIGANYGGGQQLNGTIKRIALYPVALTQTQAEALTK